MTRRDAHEPVSRFDSCKRNRKIYIRAGLFATVLITPISALAHHPLAGRTPETGVEGLLSGIGHPVIGIDHLAFIVAVGLMAAVTRRGLLMPVSFVVASLLGVMLHLQLFTIPGAELFIAGSVITFGLLLTLDKRIGTLSSVALAAIAGVFHGYAYAEAIVGAKTATLVSYLAGLSFIHLFVSLVAFYLARKLLAEKSLSRLRPLRMVGLTVASIGAAFLALGTFA